MQRKAVAGTVVVVIAGVVVTAIETHQPESPQPPPCEECAKAAAREQAVAAAHPTSQPAAKTASS
jgi:hypothetical protein